MSDLFEKYDVAVPRYTSYPTVPYWEAAPSTQDWIKALTGALEVDDSHWSMYIHVPFCESLCTFCGCNNIITRNHEREVPYIGLVLKEWELYLAAAPILKKRPLRHIHLGGGSPTFLSGESLKKLVQPILDAVVVDDKEHFEASIEVDPRRASREQLTALREMGFNRISLGVQDFNPEVQRLVNRHQPFELTSQVNSLARELGFAGVNFDLIYGLPAQTPESIAETANLTVKLSPDRIALYSFAMVPWIKPQQRLFKDDDIPKKEEKWALYRVAREIFLANGYVEVGMDHFAKKTDSMALAMSAKKLHRNFMGYTDQKSEVLLGLGVSSISEAPTCFHQSEKVIAKYEDRINKNEIPTHRGHLLTEMDKKRRKQILEIMTQFEVQLESEQQAIEAQEFLKEMIKDELVEVKGMKMFIKDKGRPFLRNISVFFDERLKVAQPQTKLFSSSI
jgi:oxygen-independent coproporphyrinogen-3 oxidase